MSADSSQTTPRLPKLATAAAVVAFLFFLAGRSLAAAGAKRGFASGWIAVSILFTFPLFFFRAFSIPTGAMEDTILLGDRVVVQTFPHLVPARGDIVVFHYPIDR